MESNLLTIIFFSLVGGLFSLIGGIIFLSNKKLALGLIKYAVPFAGGSLLGAVFLDLLKEAAHEGTIESALMFTMVGILAFFILEKLIHWVHHHHNEKENDNYHKDAKIPLIVIGDTMHNFVDGIAIGAAFLISPVSGIVTSLVVAAHEIPQEVGDFSLLLSKGMSRRKVLITNAISALASTLGAALFYLIGDGLNISLGPVLGLTSGIFIYIALSDIIPEIHRQESESRRVVGFGTIMMIIGAISVGLISSNLHSLIEHEDEDSHHDHEHSIILLNDNKS
jgi:zinc and cadmium transporter